MAATSDPAKVELSVLAGVVQALACIDETVVENKASRVVWVDIKMTPIARQSPGQQNLLEPGWGGNESKPDVSLEGFNRAHIGGVMLDWWDMA